MRALLPLESQARNAGLNGNSSCPMSNAWALAADAPALEWLLLCDYPGRSQRPFRPKVCHSFCSDRFGHSCPSRPHADSSAPPPGLPCDCRCLPCAPVLPPATARPTRSCAAAAPCVCPSHRTEQCARPGATRRMGTAMAKSTASLAPIASSIPTRSASPLTATIRPGRAARTGAMSSTLTCTAAAADANRVGFVVVLLPPPRPPHKASQCRRGAQNACSGLIISLTGAGVSTGSIQSLTNDKAVATWRDTPSGSRHCTLLHLTATHL